MRASFICPIAFVFLLLPIAACDGCGGAPPADPDGGGGGGTVTWCEDDSECEGGRCQGGACVPGGVGDDGGAGPGPGEDGGVVSGVLGVQPSTVVEFGAQLLGYPVSVDVTLSNVGNGPMKVLAVLLDDDTGEFAADPAGTLNVALQPGESVVVRVTHTPSDGNPDAAELKVLHDGEGNITTIQLFAEFKGDAELSLSEDLDAITPSAESVDFGQADTGATTTRTLWVRNTGRADSILTLSDLTLTPATAGFAFDGEPDLPLPIGAWSTALCPDDDVSVCPPGTTACTDLVCTDDEGLPLNAFPIDITYTAGTLPAQATLTLDHNGGGVQTSTDVTLTGLPTQPDIDVSPSSASFGPTLVGAPQPAEVTVTVSNVGLGPLFVTRIVEPTSTDVYSFDYSRPVPHLDGDPPLRIDAGAPPLEITVTFTPEAAEGYAAVLTLHTNDGDELQVPITLEGSGVVCQTNAHVDDVGTCVCDDGYIPCGGECKVPGATACGDACFDCTGVTGFGSGTNASCSVGGSCEYSCATAYYDINDGTDGSPGGNNWDGCEYLCPRESPIPETCNSVDDDCDGQTDEGLLQDTSDHSASNGTCSTATDLGDVNTGATRDFGRTVYPVGDVDWYRVRAHEANDDICVFCDECEDYRTEFRLLDVPAGESYTLEVRQGSCGGTVLSGQNNVVIQSWSECPDSFLSCSLAAAAGGENQGCGTEDNRTYFVRVHSTTGAQSSSCEPYKLEIKHFGLN